MSEKPNARDHVCMPLLIPVAHVFDVSGGGPYDVYGFGGLRQFEMDADQLETVLVGDCRGCGAKVDHRQDVELGEENRLPIEVAVYLHPEGDDTAAPGDVQTAIEAGWGIAPICSECEMKEMSRRAALHMKGQRHEDEPG